MSEPSPVRVSWLEDECIARVSIDAGKGNVLTMDVVRALTREIADSR